MLSSSTSDSSRCWTARLVWRRGPAIDSAAASSARFLVLPFQIDQAAETGVWTADHFKCPCSVNKVKRSLVFERLAAVGGQLIGPTAQLELVRGVGDCQDLPPFQIREVLAL